MLNIRILILSSILVLVLLLTAGLVAARTDMVSNASSNADTVSVQEQPVNLKVVPHSSSYRTQFSECYDVPIRELAACRNVGQRSAQPERPPLDECYDVSFWDVATCHDASQDP